jgi:hypothetical protein
MKHDKIDLLKQNMEQTIKTLIYIHAFFGTWFTNGNIPPH